MASSSTDDEFDEAYHSEPDEAGFSSGEDGAPPRSLKDRPPTIALALSVDDDSDRHGAAPDDGDDSRGDDDDDDGGGGDGHSQPRKSPRATTQSTSPALKTTQPSRPKLESSNTLNRLSFHELVAPLDASVGMAQSSDELVRQKSPKLVRSPRLRGVELLVGAPLVGSVPQSDSATAQQASSLSQRSSATLIQVPARTATPSPPPAGASVSPAAQRASPPSSVAAGSASISVLSPRTSPKWTASPATTVVSTASTASTPISSTNSSAASSPASSLISSSPLESTDLSCSLPVIQSSPVLDRIPLTRRDSDSRATSWIPATSKSAVTRTPLSISQDVPTSLTLPTASSSSQSVASTTPAISSGLTPRGETFVASHTAKSKEARAMAAAAAAVTGSSTTTTTTTTSITATTTTSTTASGNNAGAKERDIEPPRSPNLSAKDKDKDKDKKKGTRKRWKLSLGTKELGLMADQLHLHLRPSKASDSSSERSASPSPSSATSGSSSLSPSSRSSSGSGATPNQSSLERIFALCESDDVDFITALLLAHPKLVNEHTPQRVTPLMVACKHASVNTVRLLLDFKANVNASTNTDVGTPLHEACDAGSVAIVRMLIDAGAQVPKPTKLSKIHPIHRACASVAVASSPAVSTELAKLLISNGADINATTVDLSSPLHLATNHGNAAIVRVLCESPDIKVNVKDKNGATPLLTACTKKHEEIVSILLDAGADAQIADTTTVQMPLHRACLAASKSMAEMLLKHGATWDCWDKYTGSPLQWACSKADFALVSLLLEHGAPLNHPKYAKLGPPLLLACQRDRPIDLAKMLLENGADVNGENQQGITPLSMAISTANLPLIMLLLENKAALDSRGSVVQNIAKQTGRTIFAIYELCCVHGRADIVPALLSHPEFQPNMQVRGVSPLVLALRNRQSAIVELLIEAGAKPYGDPMAMQLLFELQDKSLIYRILRNATKKRELDLRNCNLLAFPPVAVSYLIDNPKIKVLDVSFNGLMTLPVELVDLPIEVILTNNPLLFIPETHRGSWQKIRLYLPTIKERASNWREYKLILLGEGAAGKSTLAQCLMAKRNKTACTTNLATNGINIHKGITFEGRRAKAPPALRTPELTPMTSSAAGASAAVPPASLLSSSNLPLTSSSTSSSSPSSSAAATAAVAAASAATATTAASLVSPAASVSFTASNQVTTSNLPLASSSNTAAASVLSASSAASQLSPIFNIWDLGGQEVFYPTHQLFLTKNAVYLIIFDMNDVHFSNLDYWMQQVRSLTSNSPTALVYLVGTHCDDPKCTPEYTEELKDKLKKRYPKQRFRGLHGIHIVSCKTGVGIPALKAELADEVAASGYFPAINESWIRLYDKLVEVQERFEEEPTKAMRTVSWSTFSDWASACGVPSTDLMPATRFLSDVGAVIFFDTGYQQVQYSANLLDLVVLDPQWLSDVMACLISFQHSWAKHGALPRRALQHIWRAYPTELHEGLLALLERFAIIFRISAKPSPIAHGSTMSQAIERAEENRARTMTENHPSPRTPDFEPLSAGTFVSPRPLQSASPIEADSAVSVENADRPPAKSQPPPFLRKRSLSWSSNSSLSVPRRQDSGWHLRSDVIKVKDDFEVRFAVQQRTNERKVGANRSATTTSAPLSGSNTLSKSPIRSPRSPRLLPLSSSDANPEQSSESQASPTASAAAAATTIATATPAAPTASATSTTAALAPMAVEPQIDTTNIVIPSLLPKEVPVQFHSLWSDAANQSRQGRVYHFPFLPMGFFGRILVRLMSTPDIYGRLFWRNGMVIDFEDQRGFILFDPEELVCTIQVQQRAESFAGPMATGSAPMLGAKAPNPKVRRILLRTIVDTVDSVVDICYSTSSAVVRLVPCTHCLARPESAATPFYFSYQECVEAVFRRRAVLFCHHIESPSRMVHVAHLAPDIAFADLPIVQSSTINICEEIGRGGFGAVYRATIGGVEVAVKELAGLAAAVEIFDEFQHEAYIMSCLDHPNLVRLIGICLAPSLRMILEYLPAGDLCKFLHPTLGSSIDPQDFPWSLRLRMALDIAKGMQYLQSREPPVVHRDLRSPNIFLASTSIQAPVRAKVADFGMARIAAPTLSGALDTWQWLAPEVIGSSQEYGSQADVYSFGVVCWEIATRLYPFDEYSTNPKYCVPIKAVRGPADEDHGVVVPELEFEPLKIKHDIIHEGLRPSLPAESEQCPAAFASLIESCWQALPSKRPTFAQAVAEIQRILLELDGDCGDLVGESPLPETDLVHEAIAIQVALPEFERSHSKRIDSFDYKVEARLEPKDFSVGTPLICCVQPRPDKAWLSLQANAVVILSLTKEPAILNRFVEMDQIVTAMAKLHSTVWCGHASGLLRVYSSRDHSMLQEIQLYRTKTPAASPISTIQMVMVDGRSQAWISSATQPTITILDCNTFQIEHIFRPKARDGLSVPYVMQQCTPQTVWVASSNEIDVFSTSKLKLLASWQAHTMPVRQILVVDKSVWTLAASGEIAVWQVNDHDISSAAVLQGHGVRSMFHPSPGRVWTISQSNLIIWDALSNSPVQEITLPDASSIRAIFSKDDMVWLLYSDGSVQVGVQWLKDSDRTKEVPTRVPTPTLPTATTSAMPAVAPCTSTTATTTVAGLAEQAPTQQSPPTTAPLAAPTVAATVSQGTTSLLPTSTSGSNSPPSGPPLLAPTTSPTLSPPASPTPPRATTEVIANTQQELASWLYQLDATTIKTILESSFNDNHLRWLIAFAIGDDKSTQLTASRLLARLAFPIELVPGFREKIEEMAMSQLLKFARQGMLSVHRKLKRDSIQTGEVLCQDKHSTLYRGTLEGHEGSVLIRIFSQLEENTSTPGEIDLRAVRFKASLMSILQHPAIVPCLGARVKGNNPFLVVPECGISLSQLIATQPQCLEEWLPRMEILSKISDSLCFLHSKNVIHRNLSSEVVYVDLERGNVAVGGFDRCVVQGEELQWTPDSSAFLAGAAPEVLRCEHHSRGSDVFSFGTILWELLSVSRAYEGLKQFEIIEKVLAGQRLDAPATAPMLLRTLLSNCWQEHPNRRPSGQQIKEMIQIAIRTFDTTVPDANTQ